jgi:F-type H+-transporting ATPase subunit epsilon
VRLVVSTPEAVVVDREIAHVRAEDRSGAFGILDRHADLITALAVSVLVARDRDGRERFVAVRGGLLTVTGGRLVRVLTREAVAGDDLRALERDVLTRFRRSAAAEARARASAERLERALLRHVADTLRTGRRRTEAGFP